MKRIAALTLLILLLCGCGTDISKTVPARTEAPQGAAQAFAERTTAPDETIPLIIADDATESAEKETTAPEPEPPENPSVSLLCAGDNLIHSAIYHEASERTGGSGYNFAPAYENVADLVAAADLAILNQETIISDEFEPSNYPLFCTPTALGDLMVKIGFDAFSISNNHVLDKGENGLISTLDYWKKNHPEQIVYGASLKEEDRIQTLEVNGITFAFLGFMEHTNGLYLPKGTKCKITYLSEYEEVERQVREADRIADCVIVSVHYGVEVSNTVTQAQLNVTRDLVDWGADIIIGTQPHTVQPMEFVNKPDGGEAFVFYCLGNFISTMENPLSMVEYIGRLTVTKDLSTGEIIISDPDPVPLINHYTKGSRNVKIYPLSDYTRELAAVHACPGFTYERAVKLIDENVKIVDLLD